MIPLYIALFTGIFCGVDHFLTTKTRLQGIYYLLHAIHNAAIVATTWKEVSLCLMDFNGIAASPTNYLAIELVFALHFYHIIMYYKKFRFDDWLHHGLMIGIALPIGTFLNSGALLGFSLFFTTGLPGGIDYAMLFLTRNMWLPREAEKQINTFLNTWIRSPGCAAQAALTLAFLSTQKGLLPQTHVWGAVASAFLNYWNGQYFMSQVVYDAGLRHIYGPPLATA